jgi:hypothetical protein
LPMSDVPLKFGYHDYLPAAWGVSWSDRALTIVRSPVVSGHSGDDRSRTLHAENQGYQLVLSLE